MPLSVRKSFTMLLLSSIIFSLMFTSCANYKQVRYFQDIPDTLQSPPMEVVHQPYVEPKIKPNDILNVNITTLDPNATVVFKQSISQESEQDNGIGYMVNRNGQIDLPVVGLVEVAGLTTYEATRVIRDEVAKYYKKPVVNIQFGNFYFTALGDVRLPGRYYVTNEKVSIVDAIGMASDLQVTGRRDNVMLIREEDGKKKFVRFDLNSSDVFKSPYYYLKSGDVIYVEPNKAKAKGAIMDSTRDRYISYLVSVLSITISLVSILSR